MSALSTTTSPATEALENFLGSNKRVKRSSEDSPNASFSFDMSELFNESTEEAFPSIAWSFDDAEDDDDDKSVSSTCTNSSSMTSSSDSSLGKRARTGGLTRSKTLRSSIDLLG